MTDTRAWQKSSYSGGGDGAECLEVMGHGDDMVHIRESDARHLAIKPTHLAFAALIRRAKHG